MARIRTIKPEFPQSESMGRVSRDARLCFVMMWTIADDSGRLRGNSRMLASLLFPYDDDAPALMDSWMAELEREGCVMRYQADGGSYVQIANWLSHQKIDKPSQSKLPSFEEGSRILANSRECSSEDQGSKDQGPKDQGKEEDAPRDVADRSAPALGESFLKTQGVSDQSAKDWLKVRKGKRAPLTQSAWDDLVAEAKKAGITPAEAVSVCARKSWQGFNASWGWQSNAPPSAAGKHAGFNEKDYRAGVNADGTLA